MQILFTYTLTWYLVRSSVVLAFAVESVCETVNIKDLNARHDWMQKGKTKEMGTSLTLSFLECTEFSFQAIEKKFLAKNFLLVWCILKIAVCGFRLECEISKVSFMHIYGKRCSYQKCKSNVMLSLSQSVPYFTTANFFFILVIDKWKKWTWLSNYENDKVFGQHNGEFFYKNCHDVNSENRELWSMLCQNFLKQYFLSRQIRNLHSHECN